MLNIKILWISFSFWRMPNDPTTCCRRYWNGHAMPRLKALIPTQKLLHGKPTYSGCTKLWSTHTRDSSLRYCQWILKIMTKLKMLFALTLYLHCCHCCKMSQGWQLKAFPSRTAIAKSTPSTSSNKHTCTGLSSVRASSFLFCQLD